MDTPKPLDYGMWLPPRISDTPHAVGIDNIINWIHVVMVVIFIVWGVIFCYWLWKYRHREGHKAQYEPIKGKFSKYIEVAVLGVELILLFALSMPIWAAYRNVPKLEEFTKPPLVMRITAEQFSWSAHYPGADGKFGQTKIELVGDTNPLGLDPADPDGKDDIVPIVKPIGQGEFHFPVDRAIIIHLRSKDVIHSFFFPEVRIKQDAIPGMDTPIWFEVNRPGEYQVACAQLCGKGHGTMKAKVYVHAEEDFEAWMKKAAVVEEFNEEESK